VKKHIWGHTHPHRGPAPMRAHADCTGRITEYDAALPAGGTAIPARPDSAKAWMTGMLQEDWQRQRGTVIRLAIDARLAGHGTWTLPCEIEVGE
jgi:hypothetical protein